MQAPRPIGRASPPQYASCFGSPDLPPENFWPTRIRCYWCTDEHRGHRSIRTEQRHLRFHEYEMGLALRGIAALRRSRTLAWDRRVVRLTLARLRARHFACGT